MLPQRHSCPRGPGSHATAFREPLVNVFPFSSFSSLIFLELFTSVGHRPFVDTTYALCRVALEQGTDSQSPGKTAGRRARLSHGRPGREGRAVTSCHPV